MEGRPRSHKRHDDPEDSEMYHERQYDTRPINKINKFLDDWKIIWILGLPLFLAFGFNFKTPGSQFQEMHNNQETISKALVETNRVIGVLVFLRCEDIRTTAETQNRIAELQLNCSEIYKKLLEARTPLTNP